MRTFLVEPKKQWRKDRNRQLGRRYLYSFFRATLFSTGLLLLGGATLSGGQTRHDTLEPSSNARFKPHIEARQNIQSSKGSGQLRWKKVPSGWLYVLDYNMKEHQVLLVDPSQERIVRTYKTDSLPDMALSPDGARLYIASTRYSEDGNSSQGFLTVFDTKTGGVLSRIANPDRWLPTGPTSSSMMAFSRDGRLLYIFKHLLTPQVDTYYVAAFDAKRNRFLSDKVMLPGSVSGTIVPLADRGQVAVACDGTRDVRFIELDGNEVFPSSANTNLEPPRVRLSSAGSSEIGRRIGPILSSPDGGTLTVIMGDGRYMKIVSQSRQIIQTDVLDRDARRAISGDLNSANNQPDDWLADSWIRCQAPAVSPDGEKFYFGIGRLSHLRYGVQSFDRVMAFASKSLTRMATIRTSQPFESLALSPDGNHLYAISPEQSAILVIDTAEQREIRTMYGIGTRPISAIVAP
jgi:DNA-binding beta-propeller fold protein YncE